MSFWTLFSFILFSAVIGIITFVKTKETALDTSTGYFLGNRSLTAGVIAGSLLLTNISAANFIGLSAQMYTGNMSPMGWAVSSAVPLVVVALFLIPKYLQQGIVTIPEFIEKRFGEKTQRIVSGLFLLSYIFNMLPITLYAGAVAMNQIFHIEASFGITYTQSIWLSVWVIGVIGALYAILGGLKAVAISDTINGAVLILGGLLVPFFGVLYLGDGNFLEGINITLNSNPQKFNSIGKSTDPLPFFTQFTGLMLVNLYYWGTDQSIIQRALGAKNLKEAQKGIICAGILKVLTPLILVIPGLLGFLIFLPEEVTKADTIYPMLVNKVLPKPLLGFFAAAMMGAVLSTFNSVLNSASTIFAINIYKLKENETEIDMVRKSKIFGLVIAVISMTIAPFIANAQSLYTYLQMINGFFNVPIFTIVFMGYITKKVPSVAANIALVFFVVTYGITQTVWDTGIHYLHISAILFTISCIIMLVIGKFNPLKEEFVLPDNKVVDTTPWDYRYRGCGLTVFTMIAMYIVFSNIGLARVGGINIDTFFAIVVTFVICMGVSIVFEKRSIVNNRKEVDE